MFKITVSVRITIRIGRIYLGDQDKNSSHLQGETPGIPIQSQCPLTLLRVVALHVHPGIVVLRRYGSGVLIIVRSLSVFIIRPFDSLVNRFLADFCGEKTTARVRNFG